MKCFIVVFSTCFDKRLFICFISLLQFTKKYLKNNFLHCEVEMWSVKSGLIVGKLYFKINNTEHHPIQFIAQNNCFSLTHTQNFSLFFFLSFFFVFLFLCLFIVMWCISCWYTLSHTFTPSKCASTSLSIYQTDILTNTPQLLSVLFICTWLTL